MDDIVARMDELDRPISRRAVEHPEYGDLADISVNGALQVVARQVMTIKAILSPDKAIPFLIASHRDVAPKQRERLGIFEGTLRFCVGIESADDIIADLDQALAI